MTEIIITNSKVENERRFTRVMSSALFDSLNGECTFSFTVMCSALNSVDVGEKVQLCGSDFNYLFNIVKISKKMSGGIAAVTVECEHKSYELNNSEYTVTKFEFNGTPLDCLTELLNGTNLIPGICDFTIPVELKINQECTRRAAVMQLIALCGGEIEYDGLAINIRRHRGSESYIELMDGRNVTDLSTDKDSRSSTDSYALTLYKNTDLHTGDNVNITFRPFEINVQTRIVSMSFDPYNRFEIQIEVGDYRPSINDSLYKLEKENSKTNQSVAEATAAIKSDTNNSQINISDTEQRIIKLSYNAYKNTYSAFCVTVKFEITTAGNVIFFIRLGPNERIRYTENFDVGKHTKTFNYPFVSEDGLNTITFHVLTDNGAEGFLPAVQTWGYVIGAAIAGDSPWDGYLEFRERGFVFKKRKKPLRITAFKETLIAELSEMHKHYFREEKLFFSARLYEKRHKTLKNLAVHFPTPDAPQMKTPPPLKAANTSNREVYLELRNPVTAVEIDVTAFKMIVTTASETLNLIPVSASFGAGDFGSTIWLMFGNSSMKDSVQAITVLYDGDSGNLHDVLNDAPCGSFQTSFMYTEFEEEQDDKGQG